jgi:predicted oxidoreductase
MQSILLGSSSIRVSRLSYGCWRIAENGEADYAAGREAVLAAVDAGFTFFDHADIYCSGHSEIAFGRVLQEVKGLREKLVIATKCGIRKPGEPAGAPVRYDFSKDYILNSCDASLKRLGIETIDLYQLHRPDWLCDPFEVAHAFSKLRQSGKVREFGVSNFSPSQVSMLQAALPFPILSNQVEISLTQLSTFTDGTLDQCLERRMTPMAWSPLGAGLLADGARSLLPGQMKYDPTRVVAVLDTMAKELNTNRTALALAWLLKHPSKIVPIVGSANPARIRSSVDCLNINLSREQWYTLLEAARGEQLP